MQSRATKLFLTVLFFVNWAVLGQNNEESGVLKNNYRYDKDLLSKEFHAGRRTALRNELPANSVAVFFSNPVRNRAADVDFDYHQDPNFYYLTGHTEPNAVLFVFKDTQTVQDKHFNEVLFIDERDPSKETWTGRILGTVEANKTLGIQLILKNTEFETFPISLTPLEHIYVAPLAAVDEESGSDMDLFTLHKHFITMLGESGKTKLHSAALNEFMSKLREVKEPEEIALMRKAIDISCKAHLELMKSLKPGMAEYQAQSILEYIFKNEGAESPSYPSIVGNGENSCVLHYTTNRKPMNNQLLLLDAAAEYHGYSADITRTLPVNGTFTTEERAIYNLVLQAQIAGIAACKAGNKFYATHMAAAKVIQEGLLKLGIISNASDYRNYFMHGTSHYLGLDVHDLSTRANLRPGNIITVEPGIYIPEGSPCDKKWWNIGVRIEDDILITSGDPDNLSGSLPHKASDIEAVMKEKGFFEEGK